MFAALTGWCAVAAAHAPGAHEEPPVWQDAWVFSWPLVALLLALALAYGVGAWRRRRRAEAGAGDRIGVETAAFAAGWLLLVLAMLGPLDVYGDWSLAVHMAQHMVLMGAVAPLLVAGRASSVALGGLPRAWARPVARWTSRPLRAGPASRAWTVLSGAAGATLLQAVVMWAWHAPAAMTLAVHDPFVHWLMHLSFLAAGLLFWSAVFGSVRDRGAGYGSGAMAIVGTMVHMGLLSALLTFAPRAVYPHYFERAPLVGLTALEDQQLAGLLMWVPTAVPYLVGGLWLAAAWMRRAEAESAG